VLAHVTLEGTMGHGSSQIGYLANYITLSWGIRCSISRSALYEFGGLEWTLGTSWRGGGTPAV
jgi:hypothetical protein